MSQSRLNGLLFLLLLQYTIFLTAKCPFTIKLTINRTDFLLGLPENTFIIGEGEKVDTNSGEIIEKGAKPGEQVNLEYNGSNISSIWIRIDVSQGFFWFDIAYTVTDAKDGK